eukprot:8678509-Pyramimonas_sp.AAC.1
MMKLSPAIPADDRPYKSMTTRLNPFRCKTAAREPSAASPPGSLRPPCCAASPGPRSCLVLEAGGLLRRARGL